MSENNTTSSNNELHELAGLQSTVWTARTIIICASLIASIAIFASVGWITGKHVLTNIRAGHVPMAPSTVLSFLTLSLALLVCVRQSINHRIRYLAQGAALLVAALCTLVIFRNAGATNLNIEQMLHLIPKNVGVGIGRMSPITATALLLAAFAALALLSVKREKLKGIAAFLAAALALSGLTIVMAYVYGRPLLYGGPLIPVALPTGAAMLFLSIGLIAAAGPTCWPLRLMVGASLDARLLRIFIPLLFLVICSDNIIKACTDALRSPYISRALIDSFLAVVIFVIFSIVVSKATSAINVSIGRADAERKLAEEQIVTSKRLLQDVVDHSQYLLFYAKDLEGRFILASQSLADLFGMKTYEQLIGKTGYDFLPKEVADQHHANDLEIIAKQSLIRIEETAETKDGDFTYLSTKFPLFDNEGRIYAVCGISTDITERKQLSEALKESELRYRSLFEQAGDYILVLEPQPNGISIIVDVNEAAIQAHGYSREEILGQPVTILDPELAPEIIAQRTNALQSAGSVSFITRHRRKDGTWFDVDVHAHSVNIGEKSIILSVERDITERKLAEQALNDSEERFRNLINNAMFGMAVHEIVLDEVGKPVNYIFLQVNPAFEMQTGLSIVDIVGKRITEVIPGIEDAPFIEVYGKVAITGESVVFEQYVESLHRHFHIGAYQVSPGRFATVFVDITALKQAELEIKQLNATLEQRVKDRTIELEVANNELEAFAYSVSHDLRTPLRAIDGFSMAVLEEYGATLDAHGQNYLHRVRAATVRMSDLIDDLLKLSRVSRDEMHCKKVCLSDLANAIISNLHQTDPERDVEFSVEPSIIVEGDEHLLSVMLENILGNAWKFTGKKPKAVIELGVTKIDKEKVYFVRDNGAGFDMAYANKLFGAFQRLHSVSEFPGTGIGLATVRRIINRHGGRVWAEAEVDKGAAFYFTLKRG